MDPYQLEKDLVDEVRMFAQGRNIPEWLVPRLLRIVAERWEIAMQSERDELVRQFVDMRGL